MTQIITFSKARSVKRDVGSSFKLRTPRVKAGGRLKADGPKWVTEGLFSALSGLRCALLAVGQ